MPIRPKTRNPIQQPSFPIDRCGNDLGDEVCDPGPGGGGLFPNWPGLNTFYPTRAQVYYATQQQDDFGAVKKEWIPDHWIRCEVNQTTNYKDQQIVPDQIMIVEDMLSLHTPDDVRIDSAGELHSMTDILIADISDVRGNVIYYESGGTRKGYSTLYEVSGVLPHNSPFGVDYYKTVVSRSMHQELLD